MQGEKPIPHLRVFISSPSDVSEEREIARSVITDLPRSHLLKGRVTLEPVAWDDSARPVPMIGGIGPQEAVERGLPRPSECDVVIVVVSPDVVYESWFS